jgi:hypothetical protein
MILTSEPIYHRKIRSHTGYIWEATTRKISPAILEERDRLVREGGVVMHSATTPPGVGQWPWTRAGIVLWPRFAAACFVVAVLAWYFW